MATILTPVFKSDQDGARFLLFPFSPSRTVITGVNVRDQSPGLGMPELGWRGWMIGAAWPQPVPVGAEVRLSLSYEGEVPDVLPHRALWAPPHRIQQLVGPLAAATVVGAATAYQESLLKSALTEDPPPVDGIPNSAEYRKFFRAFDAATNTQIFPDDKTLTADEIAKRCKAIHFTGWLLWKRVKHRTDAGTPPAGAPDPDDDDKGLPDWMVEYLAKLQRDIIEAQPVFRTGDPPQPDLSHLKWEEIGLAFDWFGSGHLAAYDVFNYRPDSVNVFLFCEFARLAYERFGDEFWQRLFNPFTRIQRMFLEAYPCLVPPYCPGKLPFAEVEKIRKEYEAFTDAELATAHHANVADAYMKGMTRVVMRCPEAPSTPGPRGRFLSAVGIPSGAGSGGSSAGSRRSASPADRHRRRHSSAAPPSPSRPRRAGPSARSVQSSARPIAPPLPTSTSAARDAGPALRTSSRAAPAVSAAAVPGRLSWYSVEPTLTPAGAFAALGHLRNAAALKPIPLTTDNPLDKGDFIIESRFVTSRLEAELSYAAFFTGELNASNRLFMYEFIYYHEETSPGEPHGGLILGTRYGAALRIGVRLANIDIDVSANFVAIAAAVALGRTEASYRIQGIGLGDALAELAPALPTSGDFDFEAYSKIVGLGSKLVTWANAHRDRLGVKPIQVGLVSGIDDAVERASQSYYFGMTQVARGRILADALAQRPVHLDATSIEDAYQRIMGERAGTTPPTHADRAAARSWLEFET